MLPEKKALILEEVAEGTGAAICLEEETSGMQAGLRLWFKDLDRTHSPIVTLRPAGLRRFEAGLTFGQFAADTIRQMQRASPEEVQLARALIASVARDAEVRISGNQSLDDWCVGEKSFSITAQKKGIEARFGEEALMSTCRELVIPMLAAMAELCGYDPVEETASPGHEGRLEGAVRLQLIRKRERNPRNRLLCLRVHGAKCFICRFDPASAYGDAGSIIEVHHLQPLSAVSEPRIYDPATDLVPLCPNCHRAIHTRRPVPWTPDEISSLMRGPSQMAETLLADYRSLVADLPPGWQASERLVEPLIRIAATDGRFFVALAGRRTVRGKTDIWPARSLSHNWVEDKRTARPLPFDTPQVLARLLGKANPNDLSFSDVVRLVRLDQPDIAIEADESIFEPARNTARDIAPDSPVPGLNASLFPYQASGVAWMLRTLQHTRGLVLADEMGLGKTIQIIALLLSWRPEKDSPALIICPTSLIANWRREILNFAPELSVLIHRGPYRSGISSGLRRAQIVLTTYDTVVNDLTIFSDLMWSWVICDEAQALKNPDSNRRQAIASIPRRLTVPMTGTPVETSLLDMWSLTDLAIPGLLGTRTEFERDFPDSEEAARSLSHLTDPIVLRRTVRDVAGDLPDRIDIDIPIELGEQLSSRYEQVLEETLARYPVAGALVATGQLQLFCAHPWLQKTSGADENDDAAITSGADLPLVTPKMERAIAILDEAFRSGKKVLLFALFNRCGELVRQAGRELPDAFWGAINGSTPQPERQAIVDAFSDHKGPGCLVLNPKAAGAGLNITAATIVIHYTQSWNPALEAQASARAHRRGQTEPVYIYRLFYEDTVERVMIDRSAWRRELGNEAVPVSTRDDADLRRALELRPKRND